MTTLTLEIKIAKVRYQVRETTYYYLSDLLAILNLDLEAVEMRSILAEYYGDASYSIEVIDGEIETLVTRDSTLALLRLVGTENAQTIIQTILKN